MAQSEALLPSAARTTTQTSRDIRNPGLHWLDVVLDMTNVGTGSVTVTINFKDQASGKYILLLSGAAVTTNSTNNYTVGPTAATTANVSAARSLADILQIVVTANNANPATAWVPASAKTWAPPHADVFAVHGPQGRHSS